MQDFESNLFQPILPIEADIPQGPPCLIVGENLFFDQHRTIRWLWDIIFIAPEDLGSDFRRDFERWSVGVSNGKLICIDKTYLQKHPDCRKGLPVEFQDIEVE